MESPLEVLSRAVCMVQDNANESRLTTKELPTTKWRRDRRIRASATSEYQHSISASPPPSSNGGSSSPQFSQQHQQMTKPLAESTNTNGSSTATLPSSTLECPIDMSVTSTTMKPRSPPPPYREPLPGSTFATALARPSVITQAPPKRLPHNQNSLISNRENDHKSSESISMCDPVIEEHFRRSLGADYMAVFDKKLSTPKSTNSPESPTSNSPKSIETTPPIKDDLKEEGSTSPPVLLSAVVPPTAAPVTKSPPTAKPDQNKTTPPPIVSVTNNESVGHSVDDHFAKALGVTWTKLQANKNAKNYED